MSGLPARKRSASAADSGLRSLMIPHGLRSVGEELIEAVAEHRNQALDIRLGCRRRDQGHVVERRDRHAAVQQRSEEHTSELQSLMRISYAVFCLKKKKP